MRRELICKVDASHPDFRIGLSDMPHPLGDHVLVRVLSASVNPIDAKRAHAYGYRLLGLKGAARPEMVLGNDLAGVVESVGASATPFTPGQHVFGLVDTSRAGGSHASHVMVPSKHLLPAPEGVGAPELAALPYCFTTVWQSLCGAGLTADNAAGKRVLINGASGSLGRLAVQILRTWGAEVTGIAGQTQLDAVKALGASQVLARGPGVIEALPAAFDAVLNYGHWNDEFALADTLGPQALGQASTVHPLLGNFDAKGWIGGAWASRLAWRNARRRVRARAPGARYQWVIFKPNSTALLELGRLVSSQGLAQPIGQTLPLDRANDAFEHVMSGRPGKAMLLF